MLLVPTLAALVLGGLRVQAELGNADNFRRTVGQVEVSRQVTEVAHQLQKERALMVAGVAANRPLSGTTVSDQIQGTNAAIAALQKGVAGLDIQDAGSKDRYVRAVDMITQLTTLRTLAQGGVYPDTAVFTGYSSIVDTLVQLGREVTAAAEDQTLFRTSTAVQTLDQAKERAAQLNAVVQIAAAHNSFQSDLTQNLARSADAAYNGSIADFFAVATAQERQAFSDGYSGADVDLDHLIEQTALLSRDPTAPLDIKQPETLARTSDIGNDKLRKVESDLIGHLRDQAATLADQASAAAGRDTAILIATLLLTLALMLVVAWSLLNPLRRLRLEALDIANTRLPDALDRILADPDPVEAAKHAVEPVSVFSREEIGQLARSFDLVHQQAVRMATDQAVLRDNVNAIFVNLSRRSQLLVERQLSELDRLEQNEQDPDQLARFFVLDHLATRMRRNSENLIILSGTGLAKHLSRPLPIAELIGAAISEVEHYVRVRAAAPPEVLVHGHAVKDLIHLIAELLDNATTFSASDTTVTVASRMLRAGELAIQISDEGMGMTEEEILAANQRLADPPDLDVAVSRRMGLYVVARLAQRHNIRVRLRSGEFIERGTKALITVPVELLAPLPTGDQPADFPAWPQTDENGATGARTQKLWLDDTQQQAATEHGVLTASQEVDERRSIIRARRVLDAHAQSGVSLFHIPPAEEAARPEPAPPEAEALTTTRLPIYEEVLSRWFQADDVPPPEPIWPAEGNHAEHGSGGHDNGKPSADSLTTTAPDEPASTGGQAEAPTPEPDVNPIPAPANGSASDWHSPADEGWQVVRSRLTPAPAETVTGVGLPKRVPKAHLVPGSAAANPQDGAVREPAAPEFPERSPDVVRSRLAGFQRGLGRGRRNIVDSSSHDAVPTSGDTAKSDAHN